MRATWQFLGDSFHGFGNFFRGNFEFELAAACGFGACLVPLSTCFGRFSVLSVSEVPFDS